MALIQCPECGGNVSSNAKACIHCGNPLTAPDYSIKIKLGDMHGSVAGTSIHTIAKMTYIFTDDETGAVLGQGIQHQVVTLKGDKPMCIRCHLGRGYKDAVLDYVPHENAKYNIALINTFFGARVEFQETDII